MEGAMEEISLVAFLCNSDSIPAAMASKKSCYNRSLMRTRTQLDRSCYERIERENSFAPEALHVRLCFLDSEQKAWWRVECLYDFVTYQKEKLSIKSSQWGECLVREEDEKGYRVRVRTK